MRQPIVSDADLSTITSGIDLREAWEPPPEVVAAINGYPVAACGACNVVRRR